MHSPQQSQLSDTQLLEIKLQEAQLYKAKKAVLSLHLSISEESERPLPKLLEPLLHSRAAWSKFWALNKEIPFTARLAVTRLFHNQSMPALTTMPSVNATHKIFYWLFFWLQLPLLYQTVTHFYRNAFKETFQQSAAFIQGRLPLVNVFKQSFGITLQFLKLLLLPIFLIGPLAQGLTSLPFVLINQGWLWLTQKYSRVSNIGTFLLNALEVTKDSVLLGAGLYYWSLALEELFALNELSALSSTLGILTTHISIALTLMSAAFLTLAFNLPLAERGYERTFEPIYRLCSSALVRLAGLITLTVTPAAAMVLGLSRLVHYVVDSSKHASHEMLGLNESLEQSESSTLSPGRSNHPFKASQLKANQLSPAFTRSLSPASPKSAINLEASMDLNPPPTQSGLSSLSLQLSLIGAEQPVSIGQKIASKAPSPESSREILAAGSDNDISYNEESFIATISPKKEFASPKRPQPIADFDSHFSQRWHAQSPLSPKAEFYTCPNSPEQVVDEELTASDSSPPPSPVAAQPINSELIPIPSAGFFLSQAMQTLKSNLWDSFVIVSRPQVKDDDNHPEQSPTSPSRDLCHF